MTASLRFRLPAVHAFTDDALGDADACALHRQLCNGAVTPLALAEAALARADRLQHILGPVVCDDRAAALARARRLGAEEVRHRLARMGTVAGIPTYIKDKLPVFGLPTQYGSLAFKAAVDLHNDPFTEQLLAMGLNILGKSSLPEFGFSATTEPLQQLPSRNPWNPAYSCGASSGGAGVLVASGVVPVAHANDGGGSIRIPAACCGLVGLKTSQGRHIATRKARRLPRNIVADGIVSRTVRDTAAFAFQAEQIYRNPHLPPVGRITGPSRKRLRIGVVLDSIGGLRSHPANREATLQTATLLADLGHQISECSLPMDDSFVSDFSDYWAYLAFAVARGGHLLLGPNFQPQRLDGLTRGLAARYAGKPFSLPRILWRLARHARDFRRGFHDHDLLLSPTLGHPVVRLGELSPEQPYETLFQAITEYVCFTPIANVAGTPAISLPLASDPNGLPLGLQFMAGYGGEAALLQLSFELEQAGLFQHFGSLAQSDSAG